jgi:hypothetical protein
MYWAEYYFFHSYKQITFTDWLKFVGDNSTPQPNHFLKCYTLLHSVRPIKVLHKIKLVVIVLWSHNLLWEVLLTTLVYFYISCFVNIPRVPDAILSNFKSTSFIYDNNVKQEIPLLKSLKAAKLDKIPVSITKSALQYLLSFYSIC